MDKGFYLFFELSEEAKQVAVISFMAYMGCLPSAEDEVYDFLMDNDTGTLFDIKGGLIE